ncbi:ImmA/IrrE family metallo-endopeptidase [Lactobacillus acetotolerans]|uniref:ImmA/IrrE family metallo-endopeptidase n=1 Tax=Lactobacillus acetotolerans TaxID=1600 RepID=UPI002FDB0585
MSNLTTDLLNYAFDHGIKYVLTTKLTPLTPSIADPTKRKILINLNWHHPGELPRLISHEIGHVLNHDSGILYFVSPTAHSKIEVAADVTGLKILLPMYYDRYFDTIDSHNINYDTVMTQLCIPDRLSKYVKKITNDYLTK